MLALVAALLIRPQAEVTLIAVGDIMLDRYVGQAIDKHGLDYPLAEVRPTFAKADIVVANLECPLTDEPRELQKRFVFRVPPERVGALKGIDLVSVANNHSLDCGRAGLQETLSTLEKEGIASCGVLPQATTITRKGIRVAFIGYSDFPESVPGDSPLVNYYDLPTLTKAIQTAKSRSAIVVVFPHWGIEGTAQISARQKTEASALANAGADLIVGSHPHVLQPVERIGKTVVAYSMGNFVFDAIPSQSRTAIFQFKITSDGVKSATQIPCHIKKMRPISLSGHPKSASKIHPSSSKGIQRRA